MSRKDTLVAKALNELDMLNLMAANSVSEWTGLIKDYFLNDDDGNARTSNSDSETETVMPDIEAPNMPNSPFDESVNNGESEGGASGPIPAVLGLHDDGGTVLLQAGVVLEDNSIDNGGTHDNPVPDVMLTEEIDDAMKCLWHSG